MFYKIKFFAILLLVASISISCSNKSDNQVLIKPISHATFVIEYKNEVIYIDPVGGNVAFNGQKKPTLILITDIHGDHFSNETLLELKTENITKVLPNSVYEKLDSRLTNNTIILTNLDIKKVKDNISVEAIPMYNLRNEALKFHPKGRGNGYVLTLDDKRIYISGDTEDIEEMRNLENIDIAFVCMNLPYTMPVENAADAVLDFQPKKVYPYHYRGKNGLSDVDIFKNLVNERNNNIEVVQLNWYN